MNSSQLVETLKKLKPYILTPYSLVGLAIIAFALYTLVTDGKTKWDSYKASLDENAKLEQDKSSLKQSEQKLQLISKELDKQTVKIVKVPAGSSPELVGIGIAQKLVAMSDEAKNEYISLKPLSSTSFNVDSSVTLPVSVPGMDSGADAATAAGTPPPGSAAPATPPGAPPGAGLGTAPVQGALNAFQYSIVLKGKYANLAAFLNKVAKSQDFILINNVSLKNPSSGSPTEAAPASSNPEDVQLQMDFAVPWES